MKFGHEYEKALANEGFPAEWLQSAIDYKHLKKCIKKVHRELQDIGLDSATLQHLTESLNEQNAPQLHALPPHHDYYSATEPDLTTIPEEFSPQLRVLVDSQTGTPLDVHLAPETRRSLRKLARHEIVTAGRREHLGVPVPSITNGDGVSVDTEHENAALHSIASHEAPPGAKWLSVPLASAKDFFDLLAPKLEELEQLREAETSKLEDDIFSLGEAVENVVQPVREGYEAVRRVSYRDLYFWREMFRLYLENPVFYSETEQDHGALTFVEAKKNLIAFDERLRATGLLNKMKTPEAREAAKQFLDVNLDILKIMHFQEMNARAMTKILKKFDKQTHLEGRPFLVELRKKYPALLPNDPNSKAVVRKTAGGFANSIARDLHAEIASKVLSIVPQLDDWNCPVCYSMAWRPVNLGCCRSVFCIRCIIKLQDQGMKRCPMCNAETVMGADGRHIDFETMDFLEKYFPLEAKRRQKENEKEDLIRSYGEEFVKPGCSQM